MQTQNRPETRVPVTPDDYDRLLRSDGAREVELTEEEKQAWKRAVDVPPATYRAERRRMAQEAKRLAKRANRARTGGPSSPLKP